MSIQDYSTSPNPHSFNNPRMSAEEMSKKETIFVWINILGFSNKLENEDEYKAVNQLLFEFQKHFADESGMYFVKPISNGLICELNPKRDLWDVKKYLDCLNGIAEKQANFILKYSCLVRGGISIGTRYVQQNVFIGNGLSRAYDYESRCISWPVIGFPWDEKIEKKFQNFCQISDVKEALCLKSTKNEFDKDIVFLDYKRWLKGKRSDIKNFIAEELRNNKNNLRVKMKYEWTKQYLDMEEMVKERLFQIQ